MLRPPAARTFVTLLAFSLAGPQAASAAWPHNPGTNVALCTAANTQQLPTIVADGAGGAIVTWQDARSGAGYDIYARRVLASGAVDPAWPANGRALCTAPFDQSNPTLASDGAGGAIVTWSDFRTLTDYGIYAQHVLASGAVDPVWPADGRALCTAANNRFFPTIVADGAGGAIVTWHDSRTPANGYDIYAQHVLASGAVDPAWPVDGRALCTVANNQLYTTIVADGAGGAIVTWYDQRTAGIADIYAQHVLASGAVDPAWPADGRALCTAANNQFNPTIVADGAGGAIVTWYDVRSGGSDIYAQHVLASGGVDFGWPADGRALCTAANQQYSPTIVADGAGGAIVTWYDFRTPANGYDIYAQHVLASGGVDPAWPADGRALCTAAGDQTIPVISSDGAGGAIVSWEDPRGGGSTDDIYAQHVLASGAVDPAWPVDGRGVSMAGGLQQSPAILSDGSGGAIVTWYDSRSGTSDIYAQRVARFGYLGTPEPVIASVKDVPNDQGGKVKLSWDASYLETETPYVVGYYYVYRAIPPTAAREALRHGARLLRSPGETVAPHERAVLTTVEGAQTYYWDYVDFRSAQHVLPGYGVPEATTGDSTGAYNPNTAFMVVAFDNPGDQFWASQPGLGYSVDNLPPFTPAPFSGQYAAGSAHLHWNPNLEPDLANYRLYRGNSSGFAPGPANLVGAPADTGFVDAAGSLYYYKLSAIDTHGNESGFALLLPSIPVDVPVTSLPRELALARPSPNPANVGALLSYALPRETRVRLTLFDLAGRQVRTLVEGMVPAGEHAVHWDLRGDAGMRVADGLYFLRLDAEGRHLARRLAVSH